MISRCEDAPACGHIECGFGPGVPGYGSMVRGLPYYGEHKPADDDDSEREPDYRKVRQLTRELRDELRLMKVHPFKATPTGATLFGRYLDSMRAFADDHETLRQEIASTRKSRGSSK